MKSIKTKKNIFLLIAVFILSWQGLYAQCKLERIKDNFGAGETVYSNDVTLKKVFPLIGSKEPWELVMSFMLVNGVPTITINHKSQSYSSTVNSIYFSFTDGSVIKKETPGSVSSYNTGFGYSYKLTSFFLSKEELEIFATKDLLKFQADFRNFPDYPLVEDDFKSKSAEKLKNDAGCIVTEFDLAAKAAEAKKAELNKMVEYKCEIESDKTDAFTKKRTVVTKPVMIIDTIFGNMRVLIYVCGISSNGVNQLRFFYLKNSKDYARAAANESFLKSAKDMLIFNQVDIMLDIDEAINFKTPEMSEFLVEGNNIYTFKTFPIDDDAVWKKVKSNSIKVIKYSNNDKEVATVDIPKRFSKAIINAAGCIDQQGIMKSK